MHFGLSQEQEMIVETVRQFVEQEIYPHEELVEKNGFVPDEIGKDIAQKCKELGFFGCNFPEEVGGAGLNHFDFTLVERELGRGSNALTVFFGRPSGILMACEGEQREKYLLPAVSGEKFDALALTEPGAGSDVRGMQCAAREDGDDWIVNGTKHFISHANIADFVIVFVATGEEDHAQNWKCEHERKAIKVRKRTRRKAIKRKGFELDVDLDSVEKSTKYLGPLDVIEIAYGTHHLQMANDDLAKSGRALA